jgi:H/ACA ribonucleoprotein complex subunit 4
VTPWLCNRDIALTSESEAGIELHEEVILMTTKGEGIALGIAQMSTVEMSSCDHGVVAKVKRCIMERDLYPRRWGLGPVAVEKKKLKSDGKLDKFGRANESTPAKWKNDYKDFHAPATEVEIITAEVQAKPATAVPAGLVPSPEADSDSKKRKKHDGETAEERAERKKRKADKKAAKAAKKASKGGKAESDDSD